MPIVRTYACPECNHFIEVTLAAEQWDDPPPSCSECDRREMQQQFKPVAIVGSPTAKAHAIADDIVANDYHVANINHEHRPEGTPKVRYKDENPAPLVAGPSQSRWQRPDATLEVAMAYGRQTRIQFGNGLDVLQSNLRRGVEPDLIELSKRRSIRVG